LNYFGYFTSIYEAISADPLHQIELGVFGKHFWLWIISKGDNPGYLDNKELDVLDDKYVIFTMSRVAGSLKSVSDNYPPCRVYITFPMA
jgi:hypothetical protein